MKSMLVAGVFAVGEILRAQSPAPPQLPTFRTGVDVVELDVTVLDKDRQPVRGLTAADFAIVEHGKPQPIVAFAAIDVPSPPATSAPWIRDAPLDVVDNDSEGRRLVAIVMDDAYTLFNPDNTRRAKQLALSAIEQLGPADLAAVVFTLQGRAQNFTSDRAQLKAAVDSFQPRSGGAMGVPIPCMPRLHSCDVAALATVAASLVEAPPGRKIAVLISGGRAFQFGEMGDAFSRDEAPELRDMLRNLQRANITVYAFDAHGLLPAAPTNDSLHTFAASTGGRAVTNHNSPAERVPEAFRESSSYYFLGFQTAANDGRYHKVEVKVNRPGVEVRTRSGYFAPGARAKKSSATIAGLPGGDLRLRGTAAAFASQSSRGDGEVLVVGRVDGRGDGSVVRKVDLSLSAYDLEGESQGTHRQSIDIDAGTGSAAPDLTAHVPLRPGRYMLRLAAESEGKTGSVFIDVEVPNFAKAPLSMSGLLVQRTPAPPVADKAIAALVPVSPTTYRVFSRQGSVTAFARVYQGGKGRLVPVRMTARITDTRSKVVSTQELVLEPEQFGAARAADYRIALPLAHLEPGEYLFEMEAKSGAPLVRRTMRFTVGRGL